MNAEIEVHRHHPTTLLPFRDGRIPEMLGNFQLDDHNVEEWSDTTDPSLRHRARKEMGKWIDVERNADIQIKRHEDIKKSAKGHENQRTEIIEGSAPDSTFQIVRTERQFNDGELDESSSRVSSVSTSYQMSSSRGIRSTTKSSSNQTSTKTVSISGGGGNANGQTERSDDFENLKIAFHPLDTSTQRERINVSRSGTMGVRRPPTRRPHGNSTETQKYQSMVTLDSTVSESTNDVLKTARDDQEELSIVGYKNISPKIRVGFPVEIQVELRSKLKGKDAREMNGGNDKCISSTSSTFLKPNLSEKMAQEQGSRNHNQNETYDTSNFAVGRQSYGFESFDHKNMIPAFSNPSRQEPYSFTRLSELDAGLKDPNAETISFTEGFTTSGISRSWDLMRKLESRQRLADAFQYSDPSTLTFSLSEPTLDKNFAANKPKIHNPSNNSSENNELSDYRLDSEEEASFKAPPPFFNLQPNPSPPSERSRKLIKLFDETEEAPTFNYNSLSNANKLTDWETEWKKTKSQLDRLNEAIISPRHDRLYEMRISEERDDFSQGSTPKSSGNFYPFTSRSYVDEENKKSHFNGMGILSSGGESMGRYTQLMETERESSNSSKISQTWISGVDLKKPSRHAQDNELSTSISATSDPLKKGSKKVEFSKTEVHFTPEPGRFHIVESDENKPSTVHLFRRRKRKTGLEGGHQKNSDLIGEKDQKEINSVGESGENQTEENFSTNANDLRTHALLFSKEFHRNGGTDYSNSATEDPASNFQEGGRDLEEIIIKPLVLTHNLTSDFGGLLRNTKFCDEYRSSVEKELSDMGYEEEATYGLPNLSESDNIYEELKIQKYLKQLKPVDSVNESNYAHNDLLMNQLRVDFGEDEEHFRYGSFVPLATRRSLIEMNNRNRIRRNLGTGSHVSDNSSTYSLPNSENSRDIEIPFNLKTEDVMAAEVDAGRMTADDLRYLLEEERGRVEKNGRVIGDSERKTNFPRIPSPALPPVLRSMPPFKIGQHSIPGPPTTTSGESFSFHNSKPPNPVLPIQFSTFEKTGEALRQRFFSKNPHCACNNGANNEKNSEDLINRRRNSEESLTHCLQSQEMTSNQKSDGKRTKVNKFEKNAAPTPLKSLVNIGNDYIVENLGVDRDTKTTRQEYEPNPSKGTPILRSMTFPKSNRCEPEWVTKARAKARNRESQDWMLIGQQRSSSASREREPPWISELKVKRSPGGDDLNSLSLLKSSFIYPWQKKTEDSVIKSERSENLLKNLPPEPNFLPDLEKIGQNAYKSLSAISTSTPINKSIVDLNRDFESILINPNQIELSHSSPETPAQKPKYKVRKTSKDSDSSTLSRDRTYSKKASKNEKIKSKSQESTKASEPGEPGNESHSDNRKPLQTSTAVNQNFMARVENFGEQNKDKDKTKTVHKPPNPPQRISSLVKSQTTTTFNASLEKRKKSSPTPRKVINHSNANSIVEMAGEGSSAVAVTIHRHPTLKVTKLPIRTSSASPTRASKPSSPDAKDSIKSSKTKPHVSLITEAKRHCKGKASDHLIQPKLDGTRSSRPTQPRSPVTTSFPQQKKR